MFIFVIFLVNGDVRKPGAPERKEREEGMHRHLGNMCLALSSALLLEENLC